MLFVSSACSCIVLRACHLILASQCNEGVVFILPTRKPSLREVLHTVNVQLGLSIPKSSFFSLLSCFPSLCGPSLYLGPAPFVHKFFASSHPPSRMHVCVHLSTCTHTVLCSSGVSSGIPLKLIHAVCRMTNWELWRIV